MNERIDHCLYQAGLTASGCWDELGTYEQEAIVKFAELIIKECGFYLLENGKVDTMDVIDMEQHFGI